MHHYSDNSLYIALPHATILRMNKKHHDPVDPQSPYQKYIDILASLPRPLLVLGITSIILTSVCLIALFNLNGLMGEFSEDQSDFSVVKKSTKAQNSVFIDVAGAVEQPGVYEMPENSRLLDALSRAGGLNEYADKYIVSKTFNLAKKLIDEEKVYIPFIQERQITIPYELDMSITNINSASLSELELLPSIGPITGQKIIDNRPYSSLEELLTKKVIGEKTFEKIRSMISL